MIRGLYLHIPFCTAKCGYCDFCSYPDCSSETKEAYLQALVREAGIYADMLQDSIAAGTLVLDSIYFGGGTPTCLTGGQLSLMLEAIKGFFPLSAGAEITIEGNPGTLDAAKLSVLCKAGFNRLSLGAQSFRPAELALLGRIHTVRETVEAFQMARRAGFTNIGLDLMYGLPGQQPEHWRTSLQAALDLSPEHISLYQLKIEEGTPFFDLMDKGIFREFPDDLSALMYEEAIHTLTAAGFCHYEIANFARPGQESRHNRLYWQNEEYLGLGAGASGYLKGVRYSNEAGLAEYAKKLEQGLPPVEKEERITPALQQAEAVFLGLRLLEGLDKDSFFRRYNLRITDIYGDTISKLKKAGMLREDERSIALTPKGLNLANLVFMEFLP